MTQTGTMHGINRVGERTGSQIAVTRVFRQDDSVGNGWYGDLNDPPAFQGRDSQMFYPDHLFEFVSEPSDVPRGGL